MQKYLTSKEVCEMFRITKRTLLRWHKKTQFGIPFPLPRLPSNGGGQSLYLTQDIIDWELACNEIVSQRSQGLVI